MNHDVLLERLQSDFGMQDCVLAWLKSYFSDRVQSVNIGGQTSEQQPLQTGMPQGSVLGPFSFPQYTAPLFDIAQKHECDIHMYADDTQIYVSFNRCNSQSSMQKLENCICDIRKWMKSNFLKLNDSKTEFLVLNSRQMKPIDESCIVIGEESVDAVKSARNIGAMIDCNLTMESQVSNVCRNCYLSLRQISQIRQYLTEDATATLVNALVTSKLDCNNSLLIGIPTTLKCKLQRIQNNAARLITKTNKSEDITPVLKSLHWLPVSFRIEFKVLVLCYNSLNGCSPAYMCSMLNYRDPPTDRCTLRNDELDLLREPSARLKSHGDRAFSIYAPKLWNTLPLHVRKASTPDSFKKMLKTLLFKRSFDHC